MINNIINNCKCVRCGKPASSAKFKLYGVDVGPFCKNCWVETKICDCCGKPKRYNTEITRNLKGNWLCKECVNYPVEQKISNKYFTCELCGKKHPHTQNVWKNKENQLIYYSLFINTLGGVCTDCFTSSYPSIKQNQIQHCDRCGGSTLNYIEDIKTNKKTYFCTFCLYRLQKCPECNKIHYSNNPYFICNECLPIKFYYCTFCGKIHRKDSLKGKDFVIVKEGDKSCTTKIICPKCKENLTVCYRCNSDIKKTSAIKVSDKYFCNKCGGYCGVCSKCKELSYYAIAVKDKVYCRKCGAKEKGAALILQYSYSPHLRFHGQGKLFMGFENETSFTKESFIAPGAAFIYENFGEEELFLKHDSSISQGFEVVSHPFDFNEIKKKDWESLFPPNSRKHHTCGMHIHLNKSAFTTLHLFKFLEFINSNPNFIRTIAGRDENHYSQQLTNVNKIAREKHTSSRYCKVNLNKKDTIELRFFSHATNKETFLKNVEFAQALYEFTLSNSPKISKVVTKFVEFIRENHKQFNNLADFLGLMKEKDI